MTPDPEEEDPLGPGWIEAEDPDYSPSVASILSAPWFQDALRMSKIFLAQEEERKHRSYREF